MWMMQQAVRENIRRTMQTPKRIREMTSRLNHGRMPDNYIDQWIEPRRRTSLASRLLARLFRMHGR